MYFDAVLTRVNERKRIHCPEAITPHGNNLLKNPIPITFLKIAPGCELKFRFKLVDSKIGDKTFSAVSKKALLEEILKTVGIGAKTTVGDGQLKQTTNL